MRSNLLYCKGKNFILGVENYNRYPDIQKFYRADAATTVIERIQRIFWIMGITKVMWSNKGPQYSSSSFKKFERDLGF